MTLEGGIRHMMIHMEICEKVGHIVEHYLEYRSKDDKQELKLVVYGDDEYVSRHMWKSIFCDDLHMCYSTEFPRYLVPTYYKPENYAVYEKKLRQTVACFAERKKFIWSVCNLAVPEEEPRIQLVLANRRLKRSELGRWAQTDTSEGMESGGAHQDSRFISIESLRSLVSSLLDFDPSGSAQEASPSTSASVDYCPSDGGASSSS